MTLRLGILTISDRVSRGVMEDTGGAAVEAELQPEWEVVHRAVLPDDVDLIAALLQEWADKDHLDAILTTGGTGLGPRDVTPEATGRVAERDVPGIGEAMRAEGLAQTRMAMISRARAVLRGTTLIVNLPGSPRGAAEGTRVVVPVLEHVASIVGGGQHEVNEKG